ncbi:ATP-grasp domain-containing protein [Streptomyces sp. NPDC057580]|uniref:ATP-grasp domain-containing protein n=1 Tax=Streptomyces sp. NPDC057580 TaxID=3346173 RepID=UPI00368D8E66
MTRFLFCSDPLRSTRPDAQFAGEAETVRECGGRVALLDHDALLAGDLGAALARVERGSGPYWYRGWMIPASRYEELERALTARGCSLMTDASAYRRAHELPGWYEVFAGLTPRSVWRPVAVNGSASGDEAPAALTASVVLAALAEPLGAGPGIVKDFVKSRKHQWHEACYVPELMDRAHLASVAGRFCELQGDSLAGGLVLRAYEPFVPGGEARVWWVDGEPVLVTAHPDTPDRLPSPALDPVRDAVKQLGCHWVTTDLALRDDGVWRVVEVGDGQVSGLPAGADAAPLFTALIGEGPGRSA